MEVVVVVAVVANNDDFGVQSLVVVVVAWRAPCHTVAALLQRRISLSLSALISLHGQSLCSGAAPQPRQETKKNCSWKSEELISRLV
jgi:hypothetical protein